MNLLKYETENWSIGTTSFRVTDLKYSIEKQLLILKEFNKKHSDLKWNKEKQEAYAEELIEDGSFNISNDYAKDARAKTSSLKDIGLIKQNREITDVGYRLLEISDEIKNKIERENDRESLKSNIFDIRNDSYIYLKQLLKMQVDNFQIKPIYSLIYSCLEKSEGISIDFFSYKLPIYKTKEELLNGLSNYKTFAQLITKKR